MNNKGITLIEIIISIVLISIVLIFLFSLLITVNDINYESEVNSTYLINKSLILKNIEEDFEKAKKITVNNCAINELYDNYGKNNYFPADDNNLMANKCLKFLYDWEDAYASDTDKTGLLGIYYYKNQESYVISYIRGNNKSTRILPEFEKLQANLDSLNEINEKKWDYVPGEWKQGFHKIYIPIIGTDGKDYSLNISYYSNGE